LRITEEPLDRHQVNLRSAALKIWRILILLSIGAIQYSPFGVAIAAPIDVVTTTEELRSLVEAVGGDAVRATSIVSGDRDAEEYVAKPQDILLLRRAQMVVRVGLDYDLWLNPLLARSGNALIRKGGRGYVDASQGMMLLDVRPGGLAETGHAHGAGNPHYWLDPKNAELITAGIALALADTSPADAKKFELQRSLFLERLARRQADWEKRLQPLAGRALIAYHNNWPYLARRFRLNFVGTIEPRPGVPPPPAHLAKLLQAIRDRKVAAIVVEAREPQKDAEFLARKTGIPLVTLAASVGAAPQVRSYEDLFEFNVGALEGVLREPKGIKP
jgi:ABC-type Zn uptake system ZnuABC Zn-binding protein ZnuA